TEVDEERMDREEVEEEDVEEEEAEEDEPLQDNRRKRARFSGLSGVGSKIMNENASDSSTNTNIGNFSITLWSPNQCEF
ncbi:hypothetical protein BGZ67_000659, partial [Mortierella alpina]